MKVFIKSGVEAKKLGANIRVARKRRGMSLVDLATKSNISKTALARLEKGDPSVGFGKVFNVLDVLGLLTGIAEITSPDLDREQTMKEIKILRENKGNAKSLKSKKDNTVRFI